MSPPPVASEARPVDVKSALEAVVDADAPRRHSHDHVEPTSVIETRLAELWTELLGVFN